MATTDTDKPLKISNLARYKENADTLYRNTFIAKNDVINLSEASIRACFPTAEVADNGE